MNKILILIAVILFAACDFGDNLTRSLNDGVDLFLSRDVSGEATFKSNMWLNEDGNATIYDEVDFTDQLEVTTIVSEGGAYQSSLVSNGRIWLTGFTLGNSQMNDWIINENTGLWFVCDIGLDGEVIQHDYNMSLDDTLQIDIRVYSPEPDEYHMNGTATSFDDIVFNDEGGYYQYVLTTFPGMQKYDIWGGLPDSVLFGPTVLHDITGDYIRFDVIAEDNIQIIDDLPESAHYIVELNETMLSDTTEVIVGLDDIFGSREYEMYSVTEGWSRELLMPEGAEIRLRIEAIGDPKFLNVEVNNISLQHLVEQDNEYWFEFQIDNGVVLQGADNVIQVIGID
ncbi:MAG: hypothetical protein ABH884_01735 [Candidatus Komeilibacteria bacterium]